MLLETLILALLTGLIFGGNFKKLINIDITAGWLIFLSLFLRFLPKLLSIKLFTNFNFPIYLIAQILFITSYLVLILAVVLNLKYPSMYIILIGIVMNFVVVTANVGFMPVSISSLVSTGFPMSRIIDGKIDLNHIIEKPSTRLMFLADIIPIKRPYPLPKILSIGDIVMCIGLFIFIVKQMFTVKSKQISEKNVSKTD